MRNSVIIVAGGTGKRMGAVLPKQFLEIEGKALIFYTLERFLEFDPSIEMILVIHEDYIDYWEKLIIAEGFDYPVLTVPGGETRYHSVKNGISMLEGESLVGIHDSVRPFVSLSTIQRCFESAEKYGSALPYVPLKESVRMADGDKSTVVDRSAIQVIQTPQVFNSEILRESYELPFEPSFTDDATVVEAAGHKILMLLGDEYNIKITTPEDFEMARLLIAHQKQRPL
ncbi:MAG: 2-C-methyl-D-erythritol 4-phosphate cytidylyltransferase [Bacteroidales bacterium]|nr:2-C-methyl-D-erythritol 4-phosphate cytidylyltransferase [Bacteroidales bacterium]MCB9000201.1 2-C-methyl-D-erythritol 4-phosphate cytidylyltransferase [Bacteroidales bacterium]MCB9013720.1 2-C-methyl-D-erythritol 4-phosphate cytidylyltransferase [Bacteroidales bacterium]